MPKSSGFQYRGGDRTVDSQKSRSRRGAGFDSFIDPSLPMFKPGEGENCVRILPPTWDDTDTWGTSWEIQVYLHRNVGPDNGTYLCLAKNPSEHKTCPICDARRKSSDDEERDALSPSLRALAWVIDRDDERAGPQIFSMPYSKVFKEINSRSIDKRSNALILLDDPDNGYDITFNREGSDIKTQYTAVDISRESSPLSDKQKDADRWLDYISEHPLPDCLVFYEPDYLEQVLFGAVSSRKDQEEEEEPRTRGKRAAAKEEEDEPPWEERRRSMRRAEPEEEAEDEDEKPRGRSARSRASDEEDEEPKSKNGRARYRPKDEEVDAEEDDAPRGRVAAGKRQVEGLASSRRSR